MTAVLQKKMVLFIRRNDTTSIFGRRNDAIISRSDEIQCGLPRLEAQEQQLDDAEEQRWQQVKEEP